MTPVSQKGQSIIQVLIAIGLMSIVTAGFTMMISYQQRESKALTEKLAALDLQRTLSSTLTSGAVCRYILNNPTVLTFNANAVSPTTPAVLTPSTPLYSSVSPGPVLGPVVATVGDRASVLSNSLFISSISLQITGAPSPMPAPGPGATFSGHWRIDFDSTKTVRPIKSLSISTTLAVDTTTPGQSKVTGCMDTTAPPSTDVIFSSTNIAASGSANVLKTVKVVTKTVQSNPGDKFIFMIGVTAAALGGATNVSVVLMRNNTQVFYGSASNYKGYTQTHSWFYIDTPMAGSNTYELWTGDDWQSGAWTGSASLVIMRTP